MRRGMILPVFLITICSCSKSDSAKLPHSFRTYTEQGVVVAETTGGPKYPQELFRYEKVVEIRGDLSDDRSLLVYPYPPTIDPQGNLYFADTEEHRVAVFSLDGEFIREFGQAGDGPGDIFMPTTIRIYGDTLIVTSNWTSIGMRQRITKFSKSGALLDVYIESLEEALHSQLYDVAGDGRRIGTDWETWEENGISFEQITATVIRGVNDTTAVIRSPATEKGITTTLRTSSGTREEVADYLFHARPYIRLTPPETVVVSAGFEGKIYRYDLDDNLIRIIHLNIPAEAVTQADQDSLIARYNTTIRHLQQDEHNPEAGRQIRDQRNSRDNLLFPEYKACWSWIYVDDSGYSWLRKPAERPFSNTRNDHDILAGCECRPSDAGISAGDRSGSGDP